MHAADPDTQCNPRKGQSAGRRSTEAQRMGTKPSEGSWDGHQDAVAQMATEPVQPTEALKMPSATSAFQAATQFAFRLAGLPGQFLGLRGPHLDRCRGRIGFKLLATARGAIHGGGDSRNSC